MQIHMTVNTSKRDTGISCIVVVCCWGTKRVACKSEGRAPTTPGLLCFDPASTAGKTSSSKELKEGVR